MHRVIKVNEEYNPSLNVGDAVTIATGGKQATATTTSGIFKIEEFKDATKASGSVVVGRFI